MKKESLVKDIGTTFEALLKELSKFNEDTFNEVPSKGAWTVGQTTEHIIICGSGIPDSRTSRASRPFDEKEEAIKELFLDFDQQFKAGALLEPQSPSHKKNELVQKIKKIKDHLMGVAETSDLEALCKDMEFPSFGFLTRYEWLRFIVYHTQRHTRQIRNIGKHLAKA